jgi:hypothetical protein
MNNVYLCINAADLKGLTFRFPLSIMNAERDEHLDMFPDSDADGEMLRRLQVRISETVLRIVNDSGEMLRLYPRNYYIVTSNGVETEKGNTTNYIPICDADMYNTNQRSTPVQIYFTHELGAFESGMEREEKDNDDTESTETEKEEALELYLRRVMANHLEHGSWF